MISKLLKESIEGKKETVAIWQKGSFFEKGKWKVFEVKKDNGSGAVMAIALVFIALVLIGSLVVSILPLLVTLIGFQMVREKRYLAGIVATLALIYFFIDLNNQWISSLLFYGWSDDSGVITSGLLGLSAIPYFKIINYLGFGLGLGFIVDCILVYRFGKKFNDNRITMPQIVSYIIPMIVSVFSLTLLSNSSVLINKEKNLFSAEIREYPENGIYEEKFDDGQLREKGEFKNEKKHGEWISYHSPGYTKDYGLQIKEIINYNNGIEEGLYKSFWYEGSLEYIGKYVNGKKHGKWELHFPPNLLWEVNYYDEGQPCGIWKKWEISNDMLTGISNTTEYGKCNYDTSKNQ